MLRAEILKLGFMQEPEVLAVLVWDGEKVYNTKESDPKLVGSLKKWGAIGKTGKQYFPKDGKDFMDALAYHFSSGYMGVRFHQDEEESDSE